MPLTIASYKPPAIRSFRIAFYILFPETNQLLLGFPCIKQDKNPRATLKPGNAAANEGMTRIRLPPGRLVSADDVGNAGGYIEENGDDRQCFAGWVRVPECYFGQVIPVLDCT